MVYAGVIWGYNIYHVVYCGGTTIYFFLSLSSTLQTDLLALWIILLIMGVLAAGEFIYSLMFIIFYIFGLSSSLTLTLTNIIKTYDSLAQFLANLALMATFYVYDPAAGNDDVTFQLIVISLMSVLKLFTTHMAIMFNWDTLTYSAVDKVNLANKRCGPYASVPVEENNTEQR